MSMSTSFLGLPSAPPAYSLALALAGAVYGAVFLMLSNHYVFKPKVEQYLANSSLSSKASTQFLVDFISSLPHLTFILCSMVISNSDSALSVMVYSDLGWSGLYLGLLAFGGVGSKEGGNWRLMLLKNIVCLGLAYATIWLHYLSCNYLVTLGLVLALLYLLNLLANAHEERLVSAMQFLFQYKPVEEQQRVAEWVFRGSSATGWSPSSTWPATSQSPPNKSGKKSGSTRRKSKTSKSVPGP